MRRLSLVGYQKGAVRKPFTSQTRYVTSKAKPKSKGAEDPALSMPLEKLMEEAAALPGHDQIIDFFGLGKKDPSAEWKDKKLEARVAGLFKQTMDLARVPGAALHPDDQKLQAEAVHARERLANKLFELRYHNPEKFNKLYDFLFQASFNKKLEKEQQAMSEGAIPGTHEAPWKDGNLMWQAFFDSHIKSIADTFTIEARRKQMILDGKSYQTILDQGAVSHPLKKKYPWLPDGVERLEQLDEPLAWVDARTKKKQCIFCSGNKDLYVLEPMNVPLLVRFMNMSGFIKPRKQTGLCKTMQARVARTIKHARCMGLFSYKKGEFKVNNPLNMIIVPTAEEDEMQTFHRFDQDSETAGKQNSLMGAE